MRWSKVKAVLIPLLTLLLGILIGSGGLWQRLQTQKSLELERFKHVAKLRHDINEIFFTVIELTNEYIETGNTYRSLKSYIAMKSSKGGGIDLRDPGVREKYFQFKKSESKFEDLKKKLDFVSDNYNALETQLAILENREPKKLVLKLAPPTVPGGSSISETE